MDAATLEEYRHKLELLQAGPVPPPLPRVVTTASPYVHARARARERRAGAVQRPLARAQAQFNGSLVPKLDAIRRQVAARPPLHFPLPPIFGARTCAPPRAPRICGRAGRGASEPRRLRPGPMARPDGPGPW